MSRTALIIGAGITGTLTALALTRAGWRVTVVEGRHVGAGSSSRTAAGIRQQFSTPETVLGMRYSVDFYSRFHEEVGGDSSPIVQNGYLFLLSGDLTGARARVALQHECGLSEVELLDAAETHARFPWVDPDCITGASWCPTDGFLRPETVYNEAVTAATRLGATYLSGAPVTASRGPAHHIDGLRVGERWLEADLFVDATNAWSPRLAVVLGAEPLPISPLKRYLWFLRRAGALHAEQMSAMPLVISPNGAYCRPENSDSMLTGYAHDAAPEPSFTYEDQDEIPPHFSHLGGPDNQGLATWMDLAACIPALADFEGISATTSGFYGTTPDHNPFLGFDPRRENLIRLVGFSGHGAMFGPFSAHVAAALAEAGGNLPAIDVLGRSASLAPFRPGRRFAASEAMVI